MASRIVPLRIYWFQCQQCSFYAKNVAKVPAIVRARKHVDKSGHSVLIKGAGYMELVQPVDGPGF